MDDNREKKLWIRFTFIWFVRKKNNLSHKNIELRNGINLFLENFTKKHGLNVKKHRQNTHSTIIFT